MEIAQSCLAVRLRALSRHVSTIYDEALRPFQVKVSQLNVLVAIGATGGTSPARLAGLLTLEKSTLSRNVDKLVDRGWVHVEGAGRGQQLTLTAEGAALVKTALPAWRRAQAEVEQQLGPEGAKAVHALHAHITSP